MLRESEATAGLADLREGDLLQLDFSTLADEKGGRLSIISNTPFYLTSALLFKMLGSLDDVERAVLTMQKEVGDAVEANPNPNPNPIPDADADPKPEPKPEPAPGPNCRSGTRCSRRTGARCTAPSR